jgi:hypothetical protein
MRAFLAIAIWGSSRIGAGHARLLQNRMTAQTVSSLKEKFGA